MRKKDKGYLQYSILLGMLVVALGACEKEQPPTYSGHDFLYFGTHNSSSINATYTSEIIFSCLHANNQRDTTYTNITIGFPLIIRADGRLSNEDRKISLYVEGDGKEFCQLPPADSIYIPANETEMKLNLKLIRPLMPDTGLKTLTLSLKNNEHFSPENHVWSKVTYRFGNWFIQPNNYDLFKEIYGDFSAAKMYAIQAAVDREGFWKTDSDVITLNSSLKTRQERAINFDSFSFDELYYLIDLLSLPSGSPAKNAQMAIAKKIVILTQKLIEERRAKGTPILDEAGNEISFPQQG